jgi:hypothetical protein
MSGPPLQMDDNKTILPPDPREHRRQRKIAWRQHIKQTLRRLRDSDNLFLDDSITLAEDERTCLAKANKTNKKRMAINAAHTKRARESPFVKWSDILIVVSMRSNIIRSHSIHSQIEKYLISI